MAFYQVNQRMTFEREFRGGYLCAPAGKRGGWPLMKELRTGDVLFHYNSPSGSVLGISRVSHLGPHKGSEWDASHVLPGTQCIEYVGRHLSEDDFTPEDRQKYRQNYPRYFEVHTIPIRRANMGKLLSRTPMAYLVQINVPAAERFLKDRT